MLPVCGPNPADASEPNSSVLGSSDPLTRRILGPFSYRLGLNLVQTVISPGCGAVFGPLPGDISKCCAA